MKRLLCALIALMLLGSFACAETLRVGMECNYAPYNWTQAEPSEFAVAIEGGADMPTATTCRSPSASPRGWAWTLRSSRPSGTAWCPA